MLQKCHDSKFFDTGYIENPYETMTLICDIKQPRCAGWESHNINDKEVCGFYGFMLFRIPASYNVDWDVWAELLPEQLPELLHKLT